MLDKINPEKWNNNPNNPNNNANNPNYNPINNPNNNPNNILNNNFNNNNVKHFYNNLNDHIIARTGEEKYDYDLDEMKFNKFRGKRQMLDEDSRLVSKIFMG